MKYLIALLFFFVFIDNEPNYSGKYCCENNCGNIIFIKPDKICIHELIGGHVLAYGFGNYKFIDKLIIVEYRHARKDSVYLIKKQINSDSLTIIIKDYWTKEVLPGANVELPNQYISKLTDLNGKVIFPKLHDNIVVKFSASVFNYQEEINNIECSELEIFLDTRYYIDRKIDTISTVMINDSVIVMKNGLKYRKSYCDEKTKSMY